MKRAQFSPVVYAQILHGGLVITFGNGKSSFLSASLLHDTAWRADELPQFSGAQEKAVAISERTNTALAASKTRETKTSFRDDRFFPVMRPANFFCGERSDCAGVALASVLLFMTGCSHPDIRIELPARFTGEVVIDCQSRETPSETVVVEPSGSGVSQACLNDEPKLEVRRAGHWVQVQGPVRMQRTGDGMLVAFRFVVK